jgi:hypothetical protein
MRDSTTRRRPVQDTASADAVPLAGCLDLGSDDSGEPASEGFMQDNGSTNDGPTNDEESVDDGESMDDDSTDNMMYRCRNQVTTVQSPK